MPSFLSPLFLSPPPRRKKTFSQRCYGCWVDCLPRTMRLGE
jgi:hypothetical protein